MRRNCALVGRAFFFLPAKIQCRNKESESDSLTRRVFVKRGEPLKNAAERVCFDRFKITNVIRNIHGADAVSTKKSRRIFYITIRDEEADDGVRRGDSVILEKKKNNIVPD